MLPMKNSIDASIQSPRSMSTMAAAALTPISMKIASSLFLMPVKSAIAPRIGETTAMSATDSGRDRAEARRRLRRLEAGRRVGRVERRERPR